MADWSKIDRFNSKHQNFAPKHKIRTKESVGKIEQISLSDWQKYPDDLDHKKSN